VFDSPALHSKWLLLLKIEISLVVNFCFIANKISIFSNSSHLEWRAGLADTILKWDYPSQIWFNLVQRFQRRRFKCDLLSK
jgi:hypothetical protein